MPMMLRKCCAPLARPPSWTTAAACCKSSARCFSSGHNKPFAGSVAHAPSCACTSCKGPGGRPISDRQLVSAAAATNRGVVYMAPGDVAVQPIEFPKLELDSTSSPVVSERQKRKAAKMEAKLRAKRSKLRHGMTEEEIAADEANAAESPDEPSESESEEVGSTHHRQPRQRGSDLYPGH